MAMMQQLGVVPDAPRHNRPLPFDRSRQGRFCPTDFGDVPVGEVSTRRLLLAEGSYAEGGVSDAIPCGTPEVGRWPSASGDSERCLVDVSEAGLQLARR
jgi:hypothetical protein